MITFCCKNARIRACTRRLAIVGAHNKRTITQAMAIVEQVQHTHTQIQANRQMKNGHLNA